MAENKEGEAKMAQLQLLQQNLQGLLVQKQQFQMQFNEIESALKETKDAQKVYKIIGNIMVLSTQTDIEKDLNEKREVVELRIKNIETQEERLRKKAEELQKEVMQDLKKDK